MSTGGERHEAEVPRSGEPALNEVLRALCYAGQKHRDQRRKGAGAPPFINHAIEVADLLARVAGVSDPVTLQAAILHDTVEDTDATIADIEAEFGTEVASVVAEVTDDERLGANERRRLQVHLAPRLSHRAKLVRIADKIANIRSVAWSPPLDWSRERRRDYLTWTERVVAGCRGCSPELERLYDLALAEGLQVLDAGR
jgi:(p)ppGpp synthase/HD superfamily hydrolase